VWSIDIVSSYPVRDGYGNSEASSMGAVVSGVEQLHAGLP
jgi:hypothetical protein